MTRNRRSSFSLALTLTVCAAGCTPCGQSLRVPEPGLGRMIHQHREDPLSTSGAFLDGTNVRPVPEGVVPFLRTEAKPAVDLALLREGRRSYEVMCSACHGMNGTGESVVALHMELVKPRDLTEPSLRDAGAEHFYDVATHGFGLMPSYADRLSVRQRWAVAYYVKALQLSQHADVASLPDDVQAELRRRASAR